MAKTKSKKKMDHFSILAAAGIGLAVFASLKKTDPPISVETEKVARRNLIEKVVANGKIEPVLQVKISPEVSGEITQLAVKEGQHVKKGDLLVKIKPDNYLAASNSAAASYHLAVANKSTAEANLEKARLEFERSSGLHQAKLVSDSDFLTAKTTYDVAKTTLAGALESVAMAQASLQTAAADLSKTIIYSPLDGTVSKLNSQLGERVVGTAMMAGTEIMTIADLNTMEARVDVGEVDVVLIACGEKVQLDVDSFKDRKFTGLVTDVANSANNNDTSSAASSASTTTDATKFQVKIRVSEKEAFLPGMSVTANIETRSRTNALSVPIQCVTTRLPVAAAGQTNSPRAGGISTNQTAAAGKTNETPATGTTSQTAALPDGRGNRPRAARCVAGNPARRIRRHHGAVRLRQIHADEPHRLPRHRHVRPLRIERHRRQRHGRQPARRNPQPRNRVCLPDLQPAAARSNALHNVELPLIYAGVPAEERRQSSRSTRSRRSAWPTAFITSPTNFPAASASASPSPAPWSTNRPSCWPTNRPAISIPRPARKSWRCSRNLSRRKGNTIIVVTHEEDIARHARASSASATA
jgi:HlyD family secretion protein